MYIKMMTVVLILFLFEGVCFCEVADAEYKEFLSGHAFTVSANDKGGKFVESVSVETLGYKEVRVAFHMSPLEPLVNEGEVNLSPVFSTYYNHEHSDWVWSYYTNSKKADSKYKVRGYSTAPVLGDQLTIVLMAHDFPEGKYKVTASYYLVK